MNESVLTDLADGVLTVTLNEPDTLNALTMAIGDGLFAALDRANEDDDVRVMILTGAGRGFCSGASVQDIQGRAGGDADVPSRFALLDQRGRSARLAEALSECEVPIIAAVNGVAVGAGLGIASCCDIRILGESARMGSLFIKRGLASDYGAGYWLPRIIGVARTFDLMYTGELLGAEKCLELGLANQVVPDDGLLDAARNYARNIAAGPPLAYTMLRRIMQRSTYMPLADFTEYEWASQRMLIASKDAKEGFTAFMEKREAKFTGE